MPLNCASSPFLKSQLLMEHSYSPSCLCAEMVKDSAGVDGVEEDCRELVCSTKHLKQTTGGRCTSDAEKTRFARVEKM